MRESSRVAASASVQQHRAEMIPPLALATLVVLLAALVFAIVPVIQPTSALGLSSAAALCLICIWLARQGKQFAAIACFIVVMVLLRTAPVLGSYGGPHADVFTAGQLYYSTLSAAPIFASAVLLDMPWSALISVLVIGFDQFGIWALPHDSSFDRFAGLVGGSAGLALNLVLVESLALLLGLAAARAVQRSAEQAERAMVRAASFVDQQRALERDIKTLQAAHGHLAGDVPLRVALPPTSPLYPLAVNLVVLDDHLRKLRAASDELQQVDRGLHEAALAITRIARGDFMSMPQLTDTIADPTLIALGHLQRQLAIWQRDMSTRLQSLTTSQDRIAGLARDLVKTVGYLDRAIGEAQRQPPYGLMEVQQAATLARYQVEQLAQMLAHTQPAMPEPAPAKPPVASSPEPAPRDPSLHAA
jgi:hypothetical protein